MIFHVIHKTIYSYSAPAFLEPHILRLRPRGDACQQLNNFTMTIQPKPVGLRNFTDPEGNPASCIWFEEKTTSLTIVTECEVHTLNKNPFDYLVADNNFLELPGRYSSSDAFALAPYLDVIGEPTKDLKDFVANVVRDAQSGTIEFLSMLNTAVYQNINMEIRDVGPPLPPDITFQKKRGSCRDLAVLYIEICRSAGLAARFVSGYQEGDADMEERYLHAWAEVYIPGGGWCGYDPSHGLVVADRHVAVAASRSPQGTAPVTGSLRGTGVSTEMDFNIDITVR